MLILVLIHYILTLILGLNFIYTFQIKEYRLDRLTSMVKEMGMVRFLYTSKIRLPAFSLRNILILLVHISLASLLFLYSFEQKYLFSFLGITFFLAPLTSFFIIMIGVTITSIPSSIIRSWIRMNAINNVKKSKTVFIGITGSYGKTSTKEFLAHILSAQFDVAKTPKNMNTDVGIALSINQSLKSSTQFFITELGAYRKGELNHAASYIPFQNIILCGLGNQHLDLYGSHEALVEEETSPIFNLSNQGKAYLNSDSIRRNNIDISNVSSVTYGLSPDDDAQLTNEQASTEGTTGLIRYKDTVFHINSKLLGVHSLENLLPAVALAFDIGMDKKVIEKQISSIKPLLGKLSKHVGQKNSTILHDGVNTNFNGFIAAIVVMKLFTHTNKIIMTQGIIELGGEKRSSYQSILKKMNNTGISLFSTDRLFTTIKSPVKINTFNDVDSMQKAISHKLNKDTLLLIEGIFAQPILDAFLD